MPEPGLRPSTGVNRLPRYHEPFRLPRGEALVRMLTPLPRLERTGSSVGCSPAPQRPSPYGRKVGSSEKLSRPAQGSSAFRPAHLHLGCAKEFPGGSRGRSLASPAPVATGAYRQLPGRDFHPLAFETQEVSPSALPQLKSDLLSYRTAMQVEKLWNWEPPHFQSYLFMRPPLTLACLGSAFPERRTRRYRGAVAHPASSHRKGDP